MFWSVTGSLLFFVFCFLYNHKWYWVAWLFLRHDARSLLQDIYNTYRICTPRVSDPPPIALAVPCCARTASGFFNSVHIILACGLVVMLARSTIPAHGG